jgi:hypothetical protein
MIQPMLVVTSRQNTPLSILILRLETWKECCSCDQ